MKSIIFFLILTVCSYGTVGYACYPYGRSVEMEETIAAKRENLNRLEQLVDCKGDLKDLC